MDQLVKALTLRTTGVDNALLKNLSTNVRSINIFNALKQNEIDDLKIELEKLQSISDKIQILALHPLTTNRAALDADYWTKMDTEMTGYIKTYLNGKPVEQVFGPTIETDVAITDSLNALYIARSKNADLAFNKDVDPEPGNDLLILRDAQRFSLLNAVDPDIKTFGMFSAIGPIVKQRAFAERSPEGNASVILGNETVLGVMVDELGSVQKVLDSQNPQINQLTGQLAESIRVNQKMMEHMSFRRRQTDPEDGNSFTKTQKKACESYHKTCLALTGFFGVITVGTMLDCLIDLKSGNTEGAGINRCQNLAQANCRDRCWNQWKDDAQWSTPEGAPNNTTKALRTTKEEKDNYKGPQHNQAWYDAMLGPYDENAKEDSYMGWNIVKENGNPELYCTYKNLQTYKNLPGTSPTDGCDKYCEKVCEEAFPNKSWFGALVNTLGDVSEGAGALVEAGSGGLLDGIFGGGIFTGILVVVVIIVLLVLYKTFVSK